MSLDQWAQLASGVAFPIIVAGYLLIRMEKRLEQLTRAIEQLPETIRQALKDGG